MENDSPRERMPRVHYCFSQHLNESLPPRRCTGACQKGRKKGVRPPCTCKKCKCRRIVSIDGARELVESGEAEWVIIKRNPIRTPRICPLCANDDLLKKSCSNCNKTGEIIEIVFSPERINDIVMVVRGSGEPGHEVFRSVVAKQTPRVATIEYAHIQRAYVNGYPEDQERIEEYGKSNKDFLESLIVPFQLDPWEGRTIFTFGAEGRTQGSFAGIPYSDLSEEDNYD